MSNTFNVALLLIFKFLGGAAPPILFYMCNAFGDLETLEHLEVPI